MIARGRHTFTGRARSWPAAALVVTVLLSIFAGGAGSAAAAEGESEAAWQLAPVFPLGGGAGLPVGLGHIGDIEFSGPASGLLTTAGNPPSVPAGLWFYDGTGWRELANVCGASDGRIAWAGPEEFWTVADGRPGQVEVEGVRPPLADNTLCHFAGGAVVGSYASLAFRPDSYQQMHAASCETPSNCWFGGELLPAGQSGSFHLHWDGSALSAVANPQGRVVFDMRRFGSGIYESVRALAGDSIVAPESALDPSFIHLIAPNGRLPVFTSLRPETSEELPQSLPALSPGEYPYALDYPHLGSDADSLWAAFNPQLTTPEGSTHGEVTILRYSGGSWTQLLGPGTDPAEGNPYTKFTEHERELENLTVTSIAPEPSSESAWIALDTVGDTNAPRPVAHALVARISANGKISEQQRLPSAQEEEEGIGPKGGASKITCPAPHDCWLATTQGWLFHLADAAHRTLPRDTDPAFSSLITFRPADQGVPAIVPDAPPVDNSGISGEAPPPPASVEQNKKQEARVAVPLLSHVHVAVLGRSTLRLSFKLAVKARIKLTAKRGGQVVAATRLQTLRAGNRSLQLQLDPARWPTKLSLYTHALAPLPTISAGNPSIGSLSTSMLGGGPLSRLTGAGFLP